GAANTASSSLSCSTVSPLVFLSSMVGIVRPCVSHWACGGRGYLLLHSLLLRHRTLAQQHEAIVRARDRAPHRDQVTLRIALHNHQVQRRLTRVAVMTRVLLPGKGARRIRARTTGTGAVEIHRAVAGAPGLGAPALAHAREAAALRGADDINALPRLEHVHRQRLPHFQLLALRPAEFP